MQMHPVFLRLKAPFFVAPKRGCLKQLPIQLDGRPALLSGHDTLLLYLEQGACIKHADQFLSSGGPPVEENIGSSGLNYGVSVV